MISIRKTYIRRKLNKIQNPNDEMLLVSTKGNKKQQKNYSWLLTLEKTCCPNYSSMPPIAKGGPITAIYINPPYDLKVPKLANKTCNVTIRYKGKWYCGPLTKAITYDNIKNVLFSLILAKWNKMQPR